jgi:hypothetical protein
VTLEELLRPRRRNDHLFDHLSKEAQGVPGGPTELYQERESAFRGALWRSLEG